jgi:manganese efflux pump family protein
VKLAVKTAAVAGGILVAALAGGCGAPGRGTSGGSAHQDTVAGCAAYGVHAIERHITVTWMPAPCRGLSRAEINQAAAMAVLRATLGARKAVWRRRAAEAASYLSHLVTGPLPLPSPAPIRSASPGSSAPASAALGGQDLAMDAAALIAWLVTAGSGAYVLGTWLARGGSLRQRPGAAGSPPMVILGHFGLALSGLVIWVAYLIAGWAALAWVAVGVLLPVAGLGMATLAIGLPGRSPAVAASGSHPPRGVRLSSLIAAGHGLLAVTTIMLVLLAALGTAAR